MFENLEGHHLIARDNAGGLGAARLLLHHFRLRFWTAKRRRSGLLLENAFGCDGVLKLFARIGPWDHTEHRRSGRIAMGRAKGPAESAVQFSMKLYKRTSWPRSYQRQGLASIPGGQSPDRREDVATESEPLSLH